MFSLALVEGGKPVVAVAADLASGNVFSAVKNGGAFADDKPIHVSKRSMSQAWLVFPTNLKWLYEGQKMYQALAAHSYQTNIVHGGVFKGMLVAQGLADAAIWPESIHAWDMAAVKLIVEEAGGKFTDRNDQQHRFDQELTRGVIVSNGTIHDELLEVIKNAE
jgi:fructose-1,6-bisphosphatase/inositol monophosphatase family enzyme